MISIVATTKRMSIMLVAGFLVATGLVAFVPTESVSAVSCRVFTPVNNLYEGGARTSKVIHTVPGTAVSGCQDINLRNVQNNSVASDNCVTVRVQFFPTSGGDYYGPSKFVCSKDPDGSGSQNGPVVPIATNVINGTKYRVWYNIENLSWTHSYQIVD